MSTIALAIGVVNIVGLWGLGKYIQAKRSERARNDWLDRRAARAVEEARRGADYFPGAARATPPEAT